MSPWSDICIANIFSKYVDCFFTLLMVPFDEQTLLILMKSNLQIFSFMAGASHVLFKKCKIMKVFSYIFF